MKNEMKTGTYVKGDETYTFKFFTDLTASQKIDFVNSVSGYIVTDSDYNFIIQNIIFDFEIIHKFTDYNIGVIKEADDTLGAIEELLDTTNIVQIVKENMTSGLYDELVKAVDLNIQYKTGLRNNDTIESIARILDIVEEKVKDMDMNAMTDFAKLFNNVSNEMTPNKVLEAFAKSDMYKPVNSRKKQSTKKYHGLNVFNQKRK